jgi:murein DD-endopeptidase MepM/ murein hydrolase activator NlpD
LADNSLGFFAEIDGYGTFTLELRFRSVENATVEAEKLFTVEGGGQFFALRPDDAAKPVAADYYYNWLQGELDPAVQADFVYRLPFNAGVSTSPKRLTNVDAGIMRGNFRNFVMWEFPLSKDGTIFAARAGQVVMIEGFHTLSQNADPEEAFYAGLSNAIHVEHADGTIAVYGILDNSSLMVAPGDTVYPDTPLAKAGEVEKESYGLRFHIYYYTANGSEMYPDMFSQKVYMNPMFSTEFGAIRLDDKNAATVTAQADRKLIKAEKPKTSFWRRLFGGGKK